MKYWALYFCAILLSLVIIPIAAGKSVAATDAPMIKVSINGTVQEMSIEDYTLSVLANEGAKCKNYETKKSLAVAVRSCAMYFSLYGCKHSDFSACGSGDCCLPIGDISKCEPELLAEIKSAVDETRGEILTLDKKPAMALFTLCSSKGTKYCDEFPYLTPVSEIEKCEIHKSEQIIPLNEFYASYPQFSNNDICFVYDENENCEFAIFDCKMVSGNDLCEMLKLGSSEFSITSSDDEVTLTVYGIGHGYGMSICGADRMAESFADYKKILENYYPNLALNKIYRD